MRGINGYFNLYYNCSAWLRLKLNTKIGFHTTTTHHHTNSQAAISQLLLARFGSNFKHRVPTDYNCHHNICQGNICPWDICPYQLYLSCYWPDFDQTLNIGSQQITTVTTTFVKATFVLGTFVHISNINISKLNTFLFFEKRGKGPQELLSGGQKC